MLLVLTGCTTDGPEKEISIHRNDLVLGSSARHFLSDEIFTSLEIEIVYVNGFKPKDEAVASLHSFFGKYLNKPDGINIQSRAIPSPEVGTYSIEEVKVIEKKYRTVFSKDNNLGVFIFFADKGNEAGEGELRTLGKAYLNTSMIIYDSEIQAITQTPASHTQVQTVTLHHEFGHLFGLVDNGTPAQSEHEDSDKYRAHCNVEGCLMAGIIDVKSSPLSFLENGINLLDFDQKCKIDLKANGGK